MTRICDLSLRKMGRQNNSCSIHRRDFLNSFSRLRRQIAENQKSQNRSQKHYKNAKQGKEPYQVVLTAFSVHMVRSRFFHNDIPLLELPKFAMQ